MRQLWLKPRCCWMGRVQIARCIALFVAVHRTQGLATSAFSESFSGAAADGLRLRVISWNVAAVNNNPFEYWITHPKSEYKQLMESVERSISDPGEEDILVHEVFTDEMFERLAQQMRLAQLEGVDFVEKLWLSTYRRRRIISEFLRDPVIGKKRLASMPDRVTNTIQLLQGCTYRPSVVNCYMGELGSLEVWFNKWLSFFFDEDVHLDSSGSKKVYSLLQKIRKKKYPAISDEEEAASIPLQLMMQGIFDAILMRLMLKADIPGGWEELRKEICESLNSKKSQLTQGILQETYQDADVLFLQEAGNELLSSLREKYSDAFHVAVPRSFSNERAQNSVILLRRSLFVEPKEVEIPPDGWEAGDLLLLRCQVRDGPEMALASFHGDTNGLLTIPMLSKVWQHLPVSRLLFGLDANTHEKRADGKAHVLDFEETYRSLGLHACWGERPKLYTTFNARTYLQPQLNKAAKSTELEEKGDRNPKDFVLFTKHFKVGNVIRDNTGEGRYVEDMVFPTLQFPSDHALIAVDLLLESSGHSEL